MPTQCIYSYVFHFVLTITSLRNMKLDCYSQTLQQETALQNNEQGKFQTVTRVTVERRAACYVPYIGVFWVAYQIFGRRFWRQFLSVDPRE